MSARSELTMDTESVPARDASERGTSEERERAMSAARDASERGTSEERERAVRTARTLCRIGADVAVTR